ncbi:hypothetical protein PDJAM_G00087220 [Pangasius djambal]|uniref:Uncharacterized protein n=1 Tax=Pangasius djambal TaxID=1691987 RepID=A0ACC5Z3Z9_9TELE|nr:hypothetical protein [Pangasius djambal]
MALPGKRKRISHILTNSQTSSSQSILPCAPHTELGHERGHEPGQRFVEGSIVRITMQNFLYRAAGNLVISREITVENNQSVWMINGKHASQKVVEEAVKELHIQVGNLCQFLPQEKVGEFAKMSKIELLEATEKSVGPPEMYNFHCELKNCRSKERDLENLCKEKANFLEKARQRNERNKGDVERYHKRRRHLDRIQMLEKKRPWVEYETTRKELEEVKKQREDMKRTVKSLKEAQTPLLRKIQSVESQLQPIENQMKDKTAKIREASQKCKHKQDQLDWKYKEIDDIKQSLSLKRTEEADRQKRIGITRRMIQDLQTELDSMGSQEDVTPNIEAVNAELRSIQEEKSRLEGERQDLRRDKDEATGELRRLQNRLRSLEDMMNRKEEKLRSRFRDTHTALLWLRRNRHLFEGNVRYGFFSYLRELFDAPDEVMSYLCYQYKVNDVPVGTEKTKNMIEMVIKESQMRMIYTAEEKYTVKKSTYSNKTISSNSALRPSQFLSMTIDADERRQLEDQLSMQQVGIDLQKVEDEANARISHVNEQKVAIVEEFLHSMKHRARLSMEKVYLALDTAGLSAEKTKLESDCREGSAELRRAEQVFTELDQRKASLLETCKRLMRRASEICNMNPGETVVPEILHTAFSELPNTLDEIDAMLDEEKARAEGFADLSERVVEEYNQREKEIKEMEKELEEKTKDLNTYRQNISEAKERWLIPLKQLVDQINEKFSDFFRSMNCAGEVDLHSENEEEYDKYGIRIRVKFRSSTQLHELTPHHQSGGERSVSTMLYLMALQELNRCPFRVVDEINQGMDPANERRVFDIVVKTACSGKTSQYFFITPKLLQNLKYADEMTVLCVHNGPHMLPPHKWNEKVFIRRVKRSNQ